MATWAGILGVSVFRMYAITGYMVLLTGSVCYIRYTKDKENNKLEIMKNKVMQHDLKEKVEMIKAEESLKEKGMI